MRLSHIIKITYLLTYLLTYDYCFISDNARIYSTQCKLVKTLKVDRRSSRITRHQTHLRINRSITDAATDKRIWNCKSTIIFKSDSVKRKTGHISSIMCCVNNAQRVYRRTEDKPLTGQMRRCAAWRCQNITAVFTIYRVAQLKWSHLHFAGNIWMHR